jgi:putative membrane protein
MSMWGSYDGLDTPGWAMLLLVIWLVLATSAVWALMQWLSRASRGAPPPQIPGQPSALDILNVRYARGDIDAITYQSMRERLEEPVTTRV